MKRKPKLTDPKPYSERPFACLGCDVTHEQILKLGLFPNRMFKNTIPETSLVFPLCSECATNPETIGRVLGSYFGVHADEQRCREIGLLFRLRDQALGASPYSSVPSLLERVAVLELDKAQAYAEWKEVRKRLLHLEERTGLAASSKPPAPTVRSRLFSGLWGAAIGGLMAGIVDSLEPLCAAYEAFHWMRAKLLDEIATRETVAG